MGLRDFEQLYIVKLLLHVVAALCMLVWVVKKERKTRYHQLLGYLVVISAILCGVACVEILVKGGFLLLVISEAGMLLKAMIPSMTAVIALEIYIESLFISQRYAMVRTLRHVNKAVSASAVYLVILNVARFFSDLKNEQFILSYSLPYSFYTSKSQFGTYAQLLLAGYINTVICSLTYFLRGGGSSKILFASFVQLGLLLHEETLAKYDRNHSILGLQVILMLTLSEVNTHSDRQRLSISILN